MNDPVYNLREHYPSLSGKIWIPLCTNSYLEAEIGSFVEHFSPPPTPALVTHPDKLSALKQLLPWS